MYQCNQFWCNGQSPLSSASVFIVLHLYNLFGLLWVSNFWLAFGETVLAGAFAKWYWTFDKSKVPWFALVGSFFRTLL